MLKLLFFLIFSFGVCNLYSTDIKQLKNALNDPAKNPFSYPLKINLVASKQSKAAVMICFHGLGGDYHIVDYVKSSGAVTDHLVSFNFPNAINNQFAGTFVTINELLPALYVLKRCIIHGGVEVINLYGFSAGGGAIINIIAVLNGNRFDRELENIGISQEDKGDILKAITHGHIVLECPLKSVEEMAIYQHQFDGLEQKYQYNYLRPIDSLIKWDGLSLKVLVYFEVPDEIISNRDDKLFIQNLMHANKKGTNLVIFGGYGGHSAYHDSLWEAYSKFTHP